MSVECYQHQTSLRLIPQADLSSAVGGSCCQNRFWEILSQ